MGISRWRGPFLFEITVNVIDCITDINLIYRPGLTLIRSELLMMDGAWQYLGLLHLEAVLSPASMLLAITGKASRTKLVAELETDLFVDWCLTTTEARLV